jgi:hypothetical protein
LHGFFKNLPHQRLSPNFCRCGGHPKNSNYNANRFVWKYVHAFWAVKCHTNFPANDGPYSRRFGGCVHLNGSLSGGFSQ